MKRLLFVVTILALFVVAVAPVSAAPARDGHMDIVDTAVADGRFETLVAAVTAAGLADTLKGDGPFTVFAPTDDAFAALPAGTVESLLNDIPALTDVLLYHVVAGKVMASDVVALDSADTVLGQPVAIRVDGTSVKVNDAKVIITDIETSNGVIHVIDTVLIPSVEEAAAAEESTADTPQTMPVTGDAPSGNATLFIAVVGAFLILSGVFVGRLLARAEQ